MRSTGLVVLAVCGGVGGCVSADGGGGGSTPPPPQVETTQLKAVGHFMAIAPVPGGGRELTDRTRRFKLFDVVQRRATDGTQISLDILQDSMSGGTVIPGASGMTPDDPKKTRPNYQGQDVFLTQQHITNEMGFGRYRKESGQIEIVGYSMVGELTPLDGPGARPATATAQFAGRTHLQGQVGTFFGSINGDASITANFQPFGGGTVSGRLNNLVVGNNAGPFQSDPNGIALGADILLDQTNIAGNGYSRGLPEVGGTLRLVTPGTTTSVGTVIDSDYQGSFFGPGAKQTGGTFQIESELADGRKFDAIGAFYGIAP